MSRTDRIITPEDADRILECIGDARALAVEEFREALATLLEEKAKRRRLDAFDLGVSTGIGRAASQVRAFTWPLPKKP